MAKKITFGDVFRELPEDVGQSSYSVLVEHAGDVLGFRPDYPGGEIGRSAKLKKRDLDLLFAEFGEVRAWALMIGQRIARLQVARESEKQKKSKISISKKKKK